MFQRPLIVALCLGMAVGCTKDEDTYTPVSLTAGSPKAGVAESFLRVPIGVPLGAFTARDVNLGLGGGSATQPADRRTSPWAHKFFPSVGATTGIALDVLWLTNDDRHLVFITADLGAAFDGILHEVVRELSQRTGIDLVGQVHFSVNHTHSGYAGHHGSMHFAPGFDRFDPRIAHRIVDQMVEVSMAAYADLEPAKIGLGVVEDFDPIGEDLIFADRRPANDLLTDLTGEPTGEGFKDPRAHILRVDNAAGELKALGIHFGIHGTLFNADNLWAHWDAAGAVVHGISAAFEGLPVVFLQGYAGDVKPVDDGPALASADRLSRITPPKVKRAVEAIVTTGEPIKMDSVYITVPQSLEEITVNRRGTKNFRYKRHEFDEDSIPTIKPDDIVYDDNGEVLELIDEFVAPTGGGLCEPGAGSLLAALGFGLNGTEAAPYRYCVLVDQFGDLLTDLYEMDHEAIFTQTENGPKTIEPGMTTTVMGFAKFDGIPMTSIDGDTVNTLESAKVGMMFVPGEICTLFGYRAEAYVRDLGYDAGIIVGFTNDHEGYFMTIEDWLAGGYEPGINIWGPLQGEYLLEATLPLAERGLEDFVMRTDDLTVPVTTSLNPVGFEAFEETQHVTPEAGNQVTTALPDEQFFILPAGLPRNSLDPLNPPETLRALNGFYYAAFEGGDVSVDNPIVTLEFQGESGFSTINLGDGKVANSDGPGIMLSHTPSPAKTSDLFIERRHFWTLAWQAIGEDIGESGWAQIPLGTYRFVVEGQKFNSAGNEPVPYRLELPSFEVLPGEIIVTPADNKLTLAYAEAPLGLRLRSAPGQPTAAAPLIPGTQVTLTCDDGLSIEATVDTNHQIDAPSTATGCSLVDAFGHQGSL